MNPENGGLSQEEIDAMMGGGSPSEKNTDADDGPGKTVGTEARRTDQASTSQAPTSSGPTIVPLDLLNQDRMNRSRMPTMEVLNDRFARSFRGSLFNYLRVNADIISLSAQIQKYGEYIGKIALPSYFVMVSLTPLRGSMLFIMDPYLCYAVIEAFFGGNGRLEPKLEGRDFSVIEQRVFNKIIDHAVEDFTSAWEPIIKLRPKVLRSDVKSQFVSIASSTEGVVGSVFEIEMERWSGKLYTCIPYNTVEPLREQLVSGVAADQSEMDPSWKQMLHMDIQNAMVDVSVILASQDIPLSRARTLQKGDVLSFDRVQDARVYVEDILIGEGRYGAFKNQYAVKLVSYRTPSEEDVLQSIRLKKEGINNE